MTLTTCSCRACSCARSSNDVSSREVVVVQEIAPGVSPVTVVLAVQGSQLPPPGPPRDRSPSDTAPEQAPARPVADRGTAERAAAETATAMAHHCGVARRLRRAVCHVDGPGPALGAAAHPVYRVQDAGRGQERRRAVCARRFDRRPAEETRAPSGQQDRTYQQFTTERPTFASDDLLTELTTGGATVRATPLVQQRGFLTNLLISFAPFLLLVGFYVWMFKRQQGAMGAGCGRRASRSASTPRPFASPSTTSPASTKWRPRSTRSWTS